MIEFTQDEKDLLLSRGFAPKKNCKGWWRDKREDEDDDGIVQDGEGYYTEPFINPSIENGARLYQLKYYAAYYTEEYGYECQKFVRRSKVGQTLEDFLKYWDAY